MSSAGPHLDFDPKTLPWLDRPGAEIDAYIAGLDGQARSGVATRLRQWQRDGFVVFPQAVEPRLIDQFLEDMDEMMRDRSQYSIMVNHEVRREVMLRELSELDLEHPRYRINDFHCLSTAAKRLSLNRSVIEFLTHVFRDRVIGKQSLYFAKGSEQSVHQDFAYVRPLIPSHLAASWIALEDVHPDAGPLGYFPGSHRIRKFDFGSGLFLAPDSRHREEQFARYLEAECARNGITEQRFFPRKGDIFVWHSALVHRGTEVRDRARTRKSYVTHYSTLEAWPRPREDQPVFEVNEGWFYGHPERAEEENRLDRAGPVSLIPSSSPRLLCRAPSA
jgi:ectoine hydroxylase-related dioxygenase (phytanoyl-CoA dioxygenase family)